MARRALDGNPTITTYFKEPGYGYFGKHAGYDYGVVKQPVKAPESGVITAVYTGRENVDGGNIVEMDSGDRSHRFLHLSTIGVKVGQKVDEGQQLAISGNSGKVDYHLHHDVRKKGTAWTHSLDDYYDWEAIIKQGGGEEVFTQDNYDKIKFIFTDFGVTPPPNGLVVGTPVSSALSQLRNTPEWATVVQKAKVDKKNLDILNNMIYGSYPKPPDGVILGTFWDGAIPYIPSLPEYKALPPRGGSKYKPYNGQALFVEDK